MKCRGSHKGCPDREAVIDFAYVKFEAGVIYHRATLDPGKDKPRGAKRILR